MFLVKLKGEGRPFLEWTSIYLSSKLSFACGGNVNFYKSVHHPIPTLPVEMQNTQAIFKTNQQPHLQMSVQVCSVLGQSKGERKVFFGGCEKEGHIVRLPLRALGCHMG